MLELIGRIKMKIKINFPKITIDSWHKDLEYHMQMSDINNKQLTRDQWNKKQTINKLKELQND